MDKNLRLAFRRGDLLAIALVLILAAGVLAAYLPSTKTDGGVAQIFQDGRLVKEISLTADVCTEISGEYSNVICVENGRVCISASDCPGADCVHSGWISSPGRSIVCLPNRVEIRITGASDVDFTVG